MRVVEVCPECGADILYLEICTYPPIPVRQCTKCSWRWEGQAEETLRVPFNPNGYNTLTVPNGKYKLTVPTKTNIGINI